MFAPRRTLHSTPFFCVDELLVQLELAGVNAQETLFLDIGCGDARVLTAVAQRFGCECRGWEIDQTRAQEARTRVQEAGVDNLVSVSDCNFLDDQAELLATLAAGHGSPQEHSTGRKRKRVVAFCYLTQRGLRRLAPTLRALGAFVVTFLYAVPDERPLRRIPVADPANSNRVFLMYTYDFSGCHDNPSLGGAEASGSRSTNADAAKSTGRLLQSRRRLVGAVAWFGVAAVLLGSCAQPI